jgi:transglutaminase-like putative cysteine protease
MRLRVCHETHYRYPEPVHAITMEARLQPCSDNLQTCLRFRLNVTPKTAIQEYMTYTDVTVHHWTILKAEEVRVIAESIVETRERSLLPLEATPAMIDQVEHFDYLQPTNLTAITPRIREFAAQFEKLASEDWYQAALAVREAVYKTVRYQADVTTTTTTADDVLELCAGVCQDYTHLMAATLRALRIPVRYTSGYLNPVVNQPTMTQIMQSMDNGFQSMSQSMETKRNIQGATASHAWCEVYMGPGAGWRGFCPTNNLLVDHHFVRVGAGRDFTDMTPIKGVHRGTNEEKLTVKVTVQPTEAAPV